MGALVTKALRPIRNWNVENRAHRVISREKPVPAPRYPQNEEDLRRTLEKVPDIDEKLDKKDPGLDSRLRDVYVTSTGKPEDDITREIQENQSNRKLPLNRKQVEDYEFGFKEPDRVPYGRTTLRHALNFISAHQINPAEVTADKIALEYKLKKEDVESILKYFKTYEVYLPETKQTAAMFAGPANLRKQLEMSGVKQISNDKIDSNKDGDVVKESLESKEQNNMSKDGAIETTEHALRNKSS